jgi:23S rRNA (cytosine1962-C5)-methyltransferase
VSEPQRIRLVLRPGRERPLLDGHPWLFSGAVASAGGPAEAPLAAIYAADGTPVGLGFHSPHAPLRARILSRDPDARVDRELFGGRIDRAIALRRAVLPPETDGYRLLNAEGDGIPGWTVDRFGDVLVSQTTVYGLEAVRAEAFAALAGRFPDAAIVRLAAPTGAREKSAERREPGLATADEVVAGALELPSEVPFRESGLALAAEVGGGQKTGFYCDQRENRRRVERLAGGRSVLDLFAHAGAFGLYALRGGAARVVGVESSPRQAGRAARARHVNGLEDGRAEWITADVFEHLRAGAERYDLVICDPPPFARRRAEAERAARAYKDLNRLALGRVAAGGLLLTFSCSGAVDARLFRQILFAAAVEADVELALLEPLSAGPDHPVSVFHPEGEYLKGWLARVGGPRD